MNSNDTPFDASPEPDLDAAADGAARPDETQPTTSEIDTVRRRLNLRLVIGMLVALAIGVMIWQGATSGTETTAEPRTPADNTVARASLTIVQSATPNGGVDFGYTGEGGDFSLDDPTDDDGDETGDRTQLAVVPGLVRVTQASMDAWPLDSIVCTETIDEPSFDLETRELVVQMGDGDDVVCTFSNSSKDGRSAPKAGVVTVRVGADLNADERVGEDEPWLDGWTVRLVASDGAIVNERTTDGEGRVEFSAENGSYRVCQQMMEHWTNVRPAEAEGEADETCVDVELSTNTTEAFRFVNQPPDTNPNGASSAPSISADGSRIVFSSAASNLVDDDTNGRSDVFLFDTDDGSIERITDGGGVSDQAVISADGSMVMFASAAPDLVDGDTNQSADVFVHDVASGMTTRISVASDGTEANAAASPGGISADGTRLTFSSAASNLAAGVAEFEQIYLHDLASGETTAISLNTAGDAGGNGDSAESSISADGTRIAFVSAATDLVAEPGQVTRNVYVRDTTAGITTHVSINTAGDQTDIRALDVMISADGNRVVYSSKSANLVADDTNDVRDIFLFDAATGTTNRISVVDGSEANGNSVTPTISADGLVVGYTSTATNLVDDDTNKAADIFVFDAATGTTRVSTAADGSEAKRNSSGQAMSADGQLIVFVSEAGNLVDDDNNRLADIFVRDIAADATVRISIAAR